MNAQEFVNIAIRKVTDAKSMSIKKGKLASNNKGTVCEGTILLSKMLKKTKCSREWIRLIRKTNSRIFKQIKME